MLVVVTGGVRSGKSAVATRLALEHGGEVTLAVFGDGDGDPEMAERIAAHRRDRPAYWRTLEMADALEAVRADGGGLLLVDCLGTLTAFVMESEWSTALGPYGDAAFLPRDYREKVEARVSEVVEMLIAREGNTLVVTNEVGSGLVPVHALGRLFRDVMGRANRRLVTAADAAWLVAAGKCIELTALPTDVRWPNA